MERTVRRNHALQLDCRRCRSEWNLEEWVSYVMHQCMIGSNGHVFSDARGPSWRMTTPRSFLFQVTSPKDPYPLGHAWRNLKKKAPLVSRLVPAGNLSIPASCLMVIWTLHMDSGGSREQLVLKPSSGLQDLQSHLFRPQVCLPWLHS